MGRPRETDAWWSPARFAKQLLYDELCSAKRSVCGQNKRFKDTLKKTVTRLNIDVTNWEACAQDRSLWRSMIHTGATAEKDRIAEAQKKRAARKAILYSTTSTSAGPTYPSPECGRVLQARIGLISHIRTHRANQPWHHHHHHRRSYGLHRTRWTNKKKRLRFGYTILRTCSALDRNEIINMNGAWVMTITYVGTHNIERV